MTIALLIAAAFALWVASLFLHPFGNCPRCHGTGRIWHRQRPRICPRCKGLRRRQRPGSRLVHQLARKIARERNARHAHR